MALRHDLLCGVPFKGAAYVARVGHDEFSTALAVQNDGAKRNGVHVQLYFVSVTAAFDDGQGESDARVFDEDFRREGSNSRFRRQYGSQVHGRP